MTTPTVGVVVIDHDGGELTMECLRSLVKTDWPVERLDIVLVDNASRNSVTDRVRSELPHVTVIESDVNRGFAGGCNLGIRALPHADYIAFLNNDATVDPGWLAPLVEALSDETIGAACPKIRIAGRFVSVELHSATTRRGRGDRRDVGVRVSGARLGDDDVWRRLQFVDGFWGRETGREPEAEYQWTRGASVLRVPVPSERSQPERAQLRLAAKARTQVRIRSGARETDVTVGPSAEWHAFDLDGPAVDVINNVGSIKLDDGYGADRGYLEVDDGQYDAEASVFAWCGAAVVVPRRYLDDVGLFDERLFLYYEDFELSWRGQDRGWRYQTVPASLVHHRHAASSVEGSAFFDHFGERNRLLVLARHAGAGAAFKAFVRYLLITGSYAKRDIMSTTLRGEGPRFRTVGRRLKSLAAATVRMPRMLVERRRDRRRSTRG